jgi:hypothetical protein
LEQTKATPPQSGEPHPADDDFEVPVSTVPLPSRGLIYPADSALYQCESIDVKAVSADEENILSSVSLIKSGKVLSTLMRACITNRLIDPDAMLVGDRNAVLVAIRVSAYGPAYNAKITCADCGEQTDVEFNLGRVGLKNLETQPLGGPGSNSFSFLLPLSKKNVKFKMLNAAEVAALDKDVENLKKKTGQEASVTMRLQAQITEMDGVAQDKLPRAIKAMPARDSRALRLYMDEIAPGVDMVQEYECSACGKQEEVDIPMGTEFFWPSS